MNRSEIDIEIARSACQRGPRSCTFSSLAKMFAIDPTTNAVMLLASTLSALVLGRAKGKGRDASSLAPLTNLRGLRMEECGGTVATGGSARSLSNAASVPYFGSSAHSE